MLLKQLFENVEQIENAIIRKNGVLKLISRPVRSLPKITVVDQSPLFPVNKDSK